MLQPLIGHEVHPRGRDVTQEGGRCAAVHPPDAPLSVQLLGTVHRAFVLVLS